MNRRLEQWAAFGGILLLVCSLQFGACLLGPALALLAAAACGVGASFLLLHFELVVTNSWISPVLLTAADLVAVLLAEFGVSRTFAAWFCPLVAGAAAAGTAGFVLRSRARCNLCRRRLHSQDVIFHCPRCRMDVCDQTCWSFEHRRCQLCVEQRVPILPVSESWWAQTTGPKARHGRCPICLGSPDQVDLRSCPHCRRPQCRPCWDFNNGECARCGRLLPDLPPSLTMAVAKITEPHPSSP